METKFLMFIYFPTIFLSLYIQTAKGQNKYAGIGPLASMPPCEFKNRDYMLPNGPAKSPTWGGIQKALVVEDRKSEEFINKLEKIINSVISDVRINNVDNFIRFHEVYRSKSVTFKEYFFEHYKVYSPSRDNYISQNFELLRRISRDKFFQKHYPNISNSMFLAASIPNINESHLHSFNIDDVKFFTHYAVAIKIAFSHVNEHGRISTEDGIILLDPERNLQMPATIVNPDLMVPAKSILTDIMLPDLNEPMYTDFICPISQHNLQGWKMTSNWIKFYPSSENSKYLVSDNNGVVFVGSAYCSILDTTEKYKILSPYRAWVKRDRFGRARYGIYLMVYTKDTKKENTNSKFTLILPNQTKYNVISCYQLLSVVISCYQYCFKELNDLKDDKLIRQLKLVAKKLETKYEDLVDKLKTLGKIVDDTDFLEDIKTVLLQKRYGNINDKVKTLGKIVDDTDFLEDKIKAVLSKDIQSQKSTVY